MCPAVYSRRHPSPSCIIVKPVQEPFHRKKHSGSSSLELDLTFLFFAVFRRENTLLDRLTWNRRSSSTLSKRRFSKRAVTTVSSRRHLCRVILSAHVPGAKDASMICMIPMSTANNLFFQNPKVKLLPASDRGRPTKRCELNTRGTCSTPQWNVNATSAS